MANFSDVLTYLRKRSNMSQQQLADATRLTRSAVSMYETGKREIPVHHLIALADFYHTSTDYLLGRTGCAEPYPAKKAQEKTV